MLRKATFCSIRCFSGNDPYWLHLSQKQDKYPQYAHLHWHTIDTLEIEKYSKERSAAMYGDHVSKDPAVVDWYPESSNYTKTTLAMRNTLYRMFTEYGPGVIPFLETFKDYANMHHEQMLMEEAKAVVMEAIQAEQVKSALQFGKQLIQEYESAAVRFTRESVSDKMAAFLMNCLSEEQVTQMYHGMMDIFELYGAARPMTEE